MEKSKESEGLHWRHKELLIQLAYCQLILANLPLNEEWRRAYEQHIEDIKEEINGFNSHSVEG